MNFACGKYMSARPKSMRSSGDAMGAGTCRLWLGIVGLAFDRLFEREMLTY